MKRIFGALWLTLALTGLTACTPQPEMEEAILAEPVAPVDPAAGSRKADCVSPGTDDGIGGTGCKVPAID